MSTSPRPEKRSRIWLTIGVSVAVACVLAVLLRASLATAVLRSVLADPQTRAEVIVDAIGFKSAKLHGTLDGPGFRVTLGEAVAGFSWRGLHPNLATVVLTRPTVVIDLRRGRQSARQREPAALGNLDIAISQARVIALTDAGRLELVGDAHVSGGKPQFIAATLLPARLRSGTLSLDVKNGRLTGTAAARGMHVRLAVTGDAAFDNQPRHATLNLDIPALTWNDALAADAHAATLSLTLAGKAPCSVVAQLSQVHADLSRGLASAIITAKAEATLPPELTGPALHRVPFLAADRPAMRAYESALQTLNARVRMSWSMAPSGQDIRLLEPAEITGGSTLALHLAAGAVHLGEAASGSLSMKARAPGVPQLDFALQSFTARPNLLDGAFTLQGCVTLGPVRDGVLDARGAIQTRNGVTRVRLARCAGVRLGAYVAKRTQTLLDLTGTLCAMGGEPLLSLSGSSWTLQGAAKAVGATLPSSALRITHGDAAFSVAGAAKPQHGQISLAAEVSSAGKAPRLGSGRISGSVLITDGTAHAKLAIAAGPHATPIGTIAAVEHFDTDRGEALLTFPAIAFTPQGLQPAQLSPMLAMLAQADGTAAFSGRVAWTARQITSSGRLDVDDLRFSSPLGKAQRLSTHMLLASLLPLKTAPDQRITIARVDWVQPLTRSVTLLTLTPVLLRVAETRTELAQGEVLVTPLTMPLKGGSTIGGTVEISHLALGKLIAASNLGEKLKLEGSISGRLPFTYGPSGLRIANGRLEADGPGRLSINHTLWGTGQTNAVEKAAYGALENLAFQSLSATVDSVPGGRLRAVFHVAGYDDGPGTPRAEFSLSDLLTGKAFQKQIPLPRGTAINLTLDASLNFDELLRGYQATWSQMKALNGASL